MKDSLPKNVPTNNILDSFGKTCKLLPLSPLPPPPHPLFFSFESVLDLSMISPFIFSLVPGRQDHKRLQNKIEDVKTRCAD